MHFLVDASMPRSTALRIRSLGHEATDVRDIGLGAADDESIALHTKSQQLALISRDFDFGDIRNYPPRDYPGIVVLDLPNDTPVRDVLAVVENLIREKEIVAKLSGRLFIVEFGRIRIRS